MRSKITILRPDEWGRRGVAFDGVTYRDLDTKAAFSQSVNLAILPVMEQLEKLLEGQRAMARALPPQTFHYENIRGDQLLPEGAENEEQEQEPADPWRNLTRIPLRGLLEGPPSFHNLALGVTVNEAGDREVVAADMAKLVHVAVGGSSGWGKSMFLRSLGYQLAMSADPVDLAMIDLEGVTLAPFATCERLLWPIGDTEQDAACILRELSGEIDRRKALFAAYPGVDSLYLYNERANGDGGLAPIVCLIDECTALLENKAIEAQLRTLALRARKYGLWLVLAGQDWKHNTLDSAIRNQLSTRVQFKAMSDAQSRTLLQRRGAEEIEIRGRALAWIPGRDLVTLQAPMIGYDDIIAAMGGRGPQAAMPQENQTEQARILELAGQGLSKRQIEIEVYGYAGGAATRKVGEVLDGATTVAVMPDKADPDVTTEQEQSATVVAGVDFCEFCGRDGDSMPAGVMFSTCRGCGVAICSDCLTDAGGELCPDCADK